MFSKQWNQTLNHPNNKNVNESYTTPWRSLSETLEKNTWHLKEILNDTLEETKTRNNETQADLKWNPSKNFKRTLKDTLKKI